MKEASAPESTEFVSKMKCDLDKTVNSVKCLMDDFYYFMNGKKRMKPNVTKSLKDITLEASAEQKREEEEKESDSTQGSREQIQ